MLRGASVKMLPISNIKDLQIPVPPLEVQQRIVDITSNAQKRAELYEKKTILSNQIAMQTIHSLISSN